MRVSHGQRRVVVWLLGTAVGAAFACAPPAEEVVGAASTLAVQLGARFPSLASRLRVAPGQAAVPGAATVAVQLPERADGALRLAAPGVEVSIHAAGARPAPRRDEDGVGVYRDAYRDADVLRVAAAAGAEELVHLRTPRAPTRFEYRVDVRGGRLEADGTIVGRDGATRLRLAPPFAVDGAGVRRDAVVEISGARVVVSLDPRGLVYPILLDPLWEAAATYLQTPRYDHAIALLGDGRVLVCGGTPDGAARLASCEIHDPRQASRTLTGPLSAARVRPTVTALQDGRALVCGGGDATCDLVDPVTGLVTPADSMAAARTGATATLLLDGRVLMVGGDATGAAELFDGSTWSAAGTVAPRSGGAAARHPDGRVFFLGGADPGGAAVATVDVYTPGAGWTAGVAMPAARFGHTATMHRYGRILVTGGSDGTSARTEAWTFTLATSTWSSPLALSVARTGHAAVINPWGRVLILGGDGTPATATVDQYEPNASTISATNAMTAARGRFAATLLASGDIFVVGGRSGATATASVERYTSTSFDSTAGAADQQRIAATATLLTTGEVLVTGGCASGGSNQQLPSRIYDPATNAFRGIEDLPEVRCYHTATLLPSGRVLVAGGRGGSPTYGYRTAHIFDPDTGRFTATGDMTIDRRDHTATLLPDGRVLVVGGVSDPSGTKTVLASAEVFDPSSGSWSTVGSLSQARSKHRATLLRNGLVLVTGGGNDSTTYYTKAELFDPATDGFTAAGNAPYATQAHGAVVLFDGRVMLTGGTLGAACTSATAYYTPGTGSWVSAPTLAENRCNHRAMEAPGGSVVLIGGAGYTTCGYPVFDPATRTWHTEGTTCSSLDTAAMAELLDGRVAGFGQNTVSLFDRNLNYAPSWRPVITQAPTQTAPGAQVTLAGTGFRGPTQSGSGTAAGGAADIPVVVVGSIVNLDPRMVAPTAFTDTSLTFTVPADVSPDYLSVRVVTGGIPSIGKVIPIARWELGTPCGTGASCASNHCVDGVCCAQVACLQCQSCAVSGSVGTCRNLPAGTDDLNPPSSCTGPLTCDGAGRCLLRDGQTCAVPAACGSGRCVDGVCCESACDTPCYACNQAGSLGTCEALPALATDDSPAGACVAPGACDAAGTCRKQTGEWCVLPSDCATGFCVDGFCCGTACTAPCYGCGQPGRLGACVPLPVATDDTYPAAACTGLLTCDGQGTCRPKATATCTNDGECGPGICADGYCCNERCEGECRSCNVPGIRGTCVFVPPGQPDPTGPVPCTGSNVCDGVGHCRWALGQPCQGGAQCASGYCIEGVCCDRACGAVCEGCKVAGSVGTCAFVPKHLADDAPAGTCALPLECDGAGHCRKGNGQACTAASDCASGFCADGVCCETACTAACYACNVPGQVGSCTPLELGQEDLEPAGICVGARHCDGAGACKRLAGQACAAGSDCLSGHCVDLVCCDTACTAPCFACDVAGHQGSCWPVGAGDHDRGTCVGGVAPCDRACDGSGNCVYASSATACGDSWPRCAGGVRKAGDRCDGAGQCVQGAYASCNGYACQDAVTCFAACTTAAECEPGHHCSAGACVANADRGKPCTTAAECQSGHCVDGVCCDSPCGGPCERCNLGGSEGRCLPEPRGADPDNDCPGTGPCGGACDGAGGCFSPGPTVVCRAATCSAGTLLPAATCDGQGNCVAPAAEDCVPFQCAADGTACRAGCDLDTDCQAPYFCRGAACVVDSPLGAACVSDEECQSGICVDGVCCDSLCARNCERCDAPGSEGTCTPAAAGTDPRGRCQAAEGGHPSCRGTCGADGVCAFPDTGRGCGTCAACDGTGRCTVAPADDDACGVVECSGLDTACRSYQDLTANRCATLGTCKTANDPATCAAYSDLPCADGGAPAADGGQPGADGGSGGSGGGCAVAAAHRPAAAGMLLALLLGLAVWGRRRLPGRFT